jgi:arylsulfatase A-like enzyme
LADAKPAEVDFSRPFSAGPHTVGFDYSYVLPGSLDMEPYVYVENGRVDGVPTNSVTGSKSQRQGGAGFWRGGPASPGFTHEGCQPKFAAKAIEFIRRQTTERPFFLYLPLTSPHDPWVPTPEFRGRSSAGARGDFVTQVDATVGQILDALKAAGFDRNTLVFFSSDNGAHWLPDEVKRTGHAANGPWRGMKSDAWEGGHRVPLLARWPGVIRPGRTSAALVGLNDLTATVAELLGATLPAGAAEDSRSFLGPLRGSRRAARDPLVLHSIDGVFALRQGPWKFIAAPGSGGWTKGAGTGPVQLYHLRSDPAEARDRAGAEPERVQAMAATLERIRAGRP